MASILHVWAYFNNYPKTVSSKSTEPIYTTSDAVLLSCYLNFWENNIA